MCCLNEKIEKAIKIVEEFFNKKFDRKIKYYKTEEGCGSEIKIEDGVVEFAYSSEAVLFRMILDYLSGNQSSRTYKPSYKRIGIMIDCARNGVPNIKGLKDFIVMMALLGYNYLGLYLEDCFAVNNEPYFGYMRGRYSEKELNEIVEFSDAFGVEIVPYIQTLAHISRIFNHYDVYAAEIRDTNDILLIDEPRTYELIENEIQTIASIFKSKFVNIGMDEAFLMGYGKYREIHGVCDRSEMLVRHTKKICDVCAKYGLTPIAYSDTFCRLVDEKDIPQNLVLNVWNYSFVNGKDDPINKIKNKKTFSSGVHKWYGYAPLNEFSEKIYLTAIEKTTGVYDDFSIALWGDDGSECSYNSVWYSLIKASKSIYVTSSEIDSDKTAMFLTGYNMDELLTMDLPNKVFDVKMEKPTNISKYLLFEDLFYGIADKVDSLKYTKYFKAHKETLYNLSKRTSKFSYLYKELYQLCYVLEIKNDIRINLIKAYKNRDIKYLKNLCKQILPKLIKEIEKFKTEVEFVWDKENKSFGIEVQTIRLAGLVERLKYVRNKILNYVTGKITIIEELEEVNLSPQADDDKYNGAGIFNNYEMNVTYGNITHRVYN